MVQRVAACIAVTFLCVAAAPASAPATSIPAPFFLYASPSAAALAPSPVGVAFAARVGPPRSVYDSAEMTVYRAELDRNGALVLGAPLESAEMQRVDSAAFVARLGARSWALQPGRYAWGVKVRFPPVPPQPPCVPLEMCPVVPGEGVTELPIFHHYPQFVIAPLPAELSVERARVVDGRLDILARFAAQASGDVRVRFRAGGRTAAVEAPIEDGKVRIDHALPAAMAERETGIVEIAYEGDADVRGATARVRAADGRTRLRLTGAEVHGLHLRVAGTLADRATGVVRLALTYPTYDGTLTTWEGRARVDDGRWALDEALPPLAAAQGGELVASFTGSLAEGLRGERVTTQLTP